MWQNLQTSLDWALLVILLLVNALGVVLTLLQLPGNWLILAMTAVVAWWLPDSIGVWMLLAMLVVAILGELAELLTASVGSSKAGGSKRGAVFAVVGGVVGAIGGTFVMPVIGTIFFACLGAAIGSILGDLWAGRTWDMSVLAGKGAALGKFWGAIIKLVVAVVLWLMAALAVLWP